MEILWLDEVESTQTYLIDQLKSKALKTPICVGALRQTSGKGSRGNEWIGCEGNLFISFAFERSMLPDDLKLESCSIYFAFILKEVLSDLGSNVWFKWPNDLYLKEKKLGGIITNLVGNNLVCGVGLNVFDAPENFAVLDCKITPQELTKIYISYLKNIPSWKQIFSKLEIEFYRNRNYITHSENKTIELNKAVLLEDGSLECNGQRIFSLR